METKDNRGTSRRSFVIPVLSGILEHFGRMGDAIWLFLHYVDAITSETMDSSGDRSGKVLGGCPRSDADTARAFGDGCTRKTVRRWRELLAREGYICQKRTPAGYAITVLKSKKWHNREPKEMSRSGTEMSRNGTAMSRNGTSNKTIQRLTRDNTETTTTASAETPAPEGFAFEGRKLKITKNQNEAFKAAFGWVDLQAEYRKMDSWLIANPERGKKKFGAFAQNWLSRVPKPGYPKQSLTQEEVYALLTGKKHVNGGTVDLTGEERRALEQKKIMAENPNLPRLG